ncbi:hypothetical protein AYI70_g5740, partial [Smittium culicis]
MADKNCKKSFGFKNIEPARNSTVFLPHIPGKNYENPSEIDEMDLFGSGTFDDAVLSDEFTYEVSDFEDELFIGTETEIVTSKSSALPSFAESASSESAS